MVFALWAADVVGYGAPSQVKSVKGMDVFSDLVAGVFSDRTEEHIGTVREVFRDRTGRIDYLAVAMGPSQLNRSVLLPGDRIYIDAKADRVYVAGLSKAQVEQFPPYNS